MMMVVIMLVIMSATAVMSVVMVVMIVMIVMIVVTAVIMVMMVMVVMIVVTAVVMIMMVMVVMIMITAVMVVVISMFFKQALNLSSLYQCMADRLSSKFIPWSGDDGCFCISSRSVCTHSSTFSSVIICVRLTTIVDACST